MLKTKSKFITIFVTIKLCFMTSLVYAENGLEVMPISEDPEATSEQSDLAEQTPENTNEEQPIDESASEEETQETNMKTEDVYLSGDNIVIDYPVDGNVFVMANSLTISSQVAGDVFVCSKNVTIDQTSYISGNLFAVSNNLEISGIVYDVYSLSKNITINNGYIYRDLKSVSEKFNFYGTVGRNAFVNSSSISFTDSENSTNGLVYGNFNYSSSSEIEIPEGSVSGNVNYSTASFNNYYNISSYFISLGCFLILVIVIWFIGLFIKNKFNLSVSNSNNKKRALWVILTGILGVILIPLVLIVLMFIPITSTVALLLAAIFFILLALGKSVFVIDLNSFICRKLKVNKEIGIFGVLIVTAIIIWALCLIPYNIGFVISLITTILGLGVLITSAFNKKIVKKTDKSTKKKDVATKNKDKNDK